MTKLQKAVWWIPTLVAGCATDPFDPGEAVQLDQVSYSLSLSELSSGALSTVKLDATSAAAMGNTATARKVLTVAVACALGGTQTVAFSVGGTSYSATGVLGIAPGWTSTALTTTQAAWVSACVFARVTDASTLVWLSVRGTEASLAPTISERADYQVEEGAFWGNAFPNLGAIAGYSCVGNDQATNDSYGQLPLRQCAQWDGVASSNLSPCGMSYAGRCNQVCASTVAPYSGCSFLGGAAIGPVVTVFLPGALH
ncbi:MAG TPA: hypothetical protein VLM79_10835 [Kofleriaceae bacterium]|nr:hypothetical protein [Kofleriaceae bacterium]